MHALRRAVFQVHLWVGLGLGLYLLMMSVTGVILVFEDEVRAALHPHLYRTPASKSPPIEVAALNDIVRAQYPSHRIYRIYAPTTQRDTYLVIVERETVFSRLFADAATGRIIGEAPPVGIFSVAWEAHANLFAGTRGRMINCTLGLFVLLLPATGIYLWWPRIGPWWRALWTGSNPRWSGLRNFHSVLGMWTAAFLAMFAFTGALYYFGTDFYRALGVVSRLTQPPYPYSTPPVAGAPVAAPLQPMIDAARKADPALPIWGVFPPMSDKSPIRVILGRPGDELGPDHWEWDNAGQRYVYFDQYSGKELAQWEMRRLTVADAVRSWVVPLHRGNFGGTGVKALWAIAGLAPGVLFVLGFVIWWQRQSRRRAR